MSEPSAELPPLVTMGDPLLALPSEPVPPEAIDTEAFQERLRLLAVGLEHHGANGIAAPQLGWFDRYFLMRDPAGGTERAYWINPEIADASEELIWYWEGCLSVPGYRGYIGRSHAIAVRGLNERGEALSREFTGWESHLFQHEYDHLDGMLFPYRAADPRHVVSLEALNGREAWPMGWPAPQGGAAPIRTIRPPVE